VDVLSFILPVHVPVCEALKGITKKKQMDLDRIRQSHDGGSLGINTLLRRRNSYTGTDTSPKQIISPKYNVDSAKSSFVVAPQSPKTPKQLFIEEAAKRFEEMEAMEAAKQAATDSPFTPSAYKS
jgi:hypothetical protein